MVKIKQKDSDQKDDILAPTIVTSPKLVRPKEPKINGFTTAKVGNLSKDGFSPRLIVGNSQEMLHKLHLKQERLVMITPHLD